ADWRRATARLQEELGRQPAQEEIAAAMGLSKKQLQMIEKAIRVYNSTSQADLTEAGTSLDEVVLDGNAQSPDAHPPHADDLQQVLRLIGQLEGREATVLRLRFGLDGQEPKTLKEVGEYLNLTRERVRQIEAEALRKLSNSLCPD